jgi:hypothetical protein
VLKGRYFPDTEFWHARKPRSASYTWRSLLHGRDLLYQGVRWGISDGKTVKITGDNWIPNYPPDRLCSISPIPSGATIHCLMEDDTNSWNYENVYAFFESAIAEQIVQIPISWRMGKILLAGLSLATTLIQYAQVTTLPARPSFFKKDPRRDD